MNKKDKKIINIIKKDLINLCKADIKFHIDKMNTGITDDTDKNFMKGFIEGEKQIMNYMIKQYFEVIINREEVESLNDLVSFTY